MIGEIFEYLNWWGGCRMEMLWYYLWMSRACRSSSSRSQFTTLFQFSSPKLCTRARACAVWVKIRSYRTVLLNACSTVSSMDRTMMIRWSGLDCAYVLWKGSEYSSISCLIASRTSATRSKASEPATSRSSSTRTSIIWGSDGGRRSFNG